MKKNKRVVLMKQSKLDYFYYKYRKETEQEEFSLEEIERHPCFLALNDEEQEIYLLYRVGKKGYEIAENLCLRPDQVCRKLAEIKARFEYLARFREVLKDSRKARKKFFEEFVEAACFWVIDKG